jgi:hypothetical protein
MLHVTKSTLFRLNSVSISRQAAMLSYAGQGPQPKYDQQDDNINKSKKPIICAALGAVALFCYAFPEKVFPSELVGFDGMTGKDIRYLKTLGFKIEYADPRNKPDGDWSDSATREYKPWYWTNHTIVKNFTDKSERNIRRLQSEKQTTALCTECVVHDPRCIEYIEPEFLTEDLLKLAAKSVYTGYIGWTPKIIRDYVYKMNKHTFKRSYEKHYERFYNESLWHIVDGYNTRKPETEFEKTVIGIFPEDEYFVTLAKYTATYKTPTLDRLQE